jgi:hypothetical protein
MCLVLVVVGRSNSIVGYGEPRIRHDAPPSVPHQQGEMLDELGNLAVVAADEHRREVGQPDVRRIASNGQAMCPQHSACAEYRRIDGSPIRGRH